MPKDYILKNAYKIKHIPLSIIHGRYDFVCAPRDAYLLHKALPKSKLFFVLSGHSGGDENMRIRMMYEIHKMAKK
jgi:proline iminopeptidase